MIFNVECRILNLYRVNSSCDTELFLFVLRLIAIIRIRKMLKGYGKFRLRDSVSGDSQLSLTGTERLIPNSFGQRFS